MENKDYQNPKFNHIFLSLDLWWCQCTKIYTTKARSFYDQVTQSSGVSMLQFTVIFNIISTDFVLMSADVKFKNYYRIELTEDHVIWY